MSSSPAVSVSVNRLSTLGKFKDPDDEMGWHVLPVLTTHPATAYLTLNDDVRVRTDSAETLEALAGMALRAAQALRIAMEEPPGSIRDLVDDDDTSAAMAEILRRAAS